MTSFSDFPCHMLDASPSHEVVLCSAFFSSDRQLAVPAGEKLCQQLRFYAFKLYSHHLSPTACRNFEKGLKKP